MRGRKRQRKKILKRDFISIGGGLYIPIVLPRLGKTYRSYGAELEVATYLDSSEQIARTEPEPLKFDMHFITVNVVAHEVSPGCFVLSAGDIRPT